MKRDLDTIRDSFHNGYYTYLESRKKGERTEEYYHNRYYTREQLQALQEIGQPPETFNLIKLFTRHLVGYYSKVLNTVTFKPIQMQDTATVSLLQDVYNYINRRNKWKHLGNRIKKDAFLHGLFIEYLNVVPQKTPLGDYKKDKYGRVLYEVKKEYVHPSEIILDPVSRELDYSDANFIHRFKWVSKELLLEMFPNAPIAKLNARENFLNVRESEFEYTYGENSFNGYYSDSDNFLIVHSIIKSGNRTYSIYWSGDVKLSEKEITYKEVKFPYTVVKLSDSNKAEYYGVFNDILDSVDAVNQALLQIQMNVNSDKVFVEENAVSDMDAFHKAYKRVAGIIPVNYIAGIRVEKMSSEIGNQFIIIDKAFTRIKQVLGISDAFLGMAFQYDSGRKVQLQQTATSVGLQYIDDAMELFYEIDAQKVNKLVKQYYRANQVMRLTDEITGDKWFEINKPMIDPLTGQPYIEQAIDPETGELMFNKAGLPIVAPLNYPHTDLEYSDADIIIESVDYNDGEQNQLLLEGIINGNAGQMLMSVHPAYYAKITALNIRANRSKYSQEVAQMFDDVANMLSPQPEMQQYLGSAGGASSQVGGLPNVQRRTNSLLGENK